MSRIDTFLQFLAQRLSSHESSSKHITSTVGIDDLSISEFFDGEDFWVFFSWVDVGGGRGGRGGSDDGGIGTLSDEN